MTDIAMLALTISFFVLSFWLIKFFWLLARG